MLVELYSWLTHMLCSLGNVLFLNLKLCIQYNKWTELTCTYLIKLHHVTAGSTLQTDLSLSQSWNRDQGSKYASGNFMCGWDCAVSWFPCVLADGQAVSCNFIYLLCSHQSHNKANQTTGNLLIAYIPGSLVFSGDYRLGPRSKRIQGTSNSGPHTGQHSVLKVTAVRTSSAGEGRVRPHGSQRVCLWSLTEP